MVRTLSLIHICLIVNAILGSQPGLDKAAAIHSRRRTAFFHQSNLDSLQALRQAFRPRRLTVFHPSKPAIGLRVNPVINVIFFRQAASQLNLNRLEPLRLAYRTAFLAIISPILPAVGLYMGAITDTPLGAVNINTDRLKPDVYKRQFYDRRYSQASG